MPTFHWVQSRKNMVTMSQFSSHTSKLFSSGANDKAAICSGLTPRPFKLDSRSSITPPVAQCSAAPFSFLLVPPRRSQRMPRLKLSQWHDRHRSLFLTAKHQWRQASSPTPSGRRLFRPLQPALRRTKTARRLLVFYWCPHDALSVCRDQSLHDGMIVTDLLF